MKLRIVGFMLLMGAAGCVSESEDTVLDIQGHRGARGLLPENTIPGFLLALDYNVSTIELDLVVSNDSMLIVSHEPWFNPEICLYPDGSPIKTEDALNNNIYDLTVEEIQRFDCGSLGNPRFPEQKPMSVYKPTFIEAVRAIEAHAVNSGRSKPFYNIETKSRPEGDGVYHPYPDRFAELVVNELNALGISNRTVVQSFDPRTIQFIKTLEPNLPVALLVENDNGFDWNTRQLGFIPEIYSPWYKLVDEDLIQTIKRLKIKIIPWTVNNPEEMKKLIQLGVHGIITDYPDRAQQLITENDR